jgi:hypothetical protein
MSIDTTGVFEPAANSNRRQYCWRHFLRKTAESSPLATLTLPPTATALLRPCYGSRRPRMSTHHWQSY